MPVSGLSPVVSDACGLAYTVTYDATGATVTSGNNDISGHEFVVGTTQVVYTLADTDGNYLASCSFNIEITDAQLPEITCPKNISVSSALPVTVFYNNPTATDNCIVNSVSLVSGLPSGSTFPLGVSTVTYAATDVSGNSVTCSFTVSVQPAIFPMQISSIVQSNSVVFPGPYNGSISLTVTGGNPCPGGVYNYVWAGPVSWIGGGSATGSTITGIPNGWYTVTVTDCGLDGIAGTGDEQTLVGWYYVPFKLGGGKTGLENLGSIAIVPNPFEHQTTVIFNADRSCNVEVSITDLNGREVAILYNGFAAAGESYTLPFDARGLPEGLYICRIISSDGMQLQEKLLLMEGQR